MLSDHTRFKRETEPDRTVRDPTTVPATDGPRKRRVKTLLLRIDALGGSGAPGAEDLAAFIRWRLSQIDEPQYPGGAFEFVSFAQSFFEDYVEFQHGEAAPWRSR